MTEPLIKLIDINKDYQLGSISVPALKHVSLQINRGEYIAVLGPSGSGKSTLMNILGCLDQPSHGQYFLNQQEVSQLTQKQLARIRNQTIGFIFQSFNLLPYATALENVMLPLSYRRCGNKEQKQRAQHMLERVGLADRADHRPSELSGGQRQRVAIARALVTEPDLILADEPTGNLDSRAGESVIELFESLSEQNKTIIMVTHDLKLAQRAKRIIEIQDGELL